MHPGSHRGQVRVNMAFSLQVCSLSCLGTVSHMMISVDHPQTTMHLPNMFVQIFYASAFSQLPTCLINRLPTATIALHSRSTSFPSRMHPGSHRNQFQVYMAFSLKVCSISHSPAIMHQPISLCIFALHQLFHSHTTIAHLLCELTPNSYSCAALQEHKLLISQDVCKMKGLCCWNAVHQKELGIVQVSWWI